MLSDILDKLQNDEELTVFLNSTEEDSKIYINVGRNGTCISYKYYFVVSDGLKTQSKLEINAISEDYKTAEQIINKVKEILITKGNNQFNNNITTISLNGGGYLFDEDTKQHLLKAYFIVLNKERI